LHNNDQYAVLFHKFWKDPNLTITTYHALSIYDSLVEG
jgi:hypothetical protein